MKSIVLKAFLLSTFFCFTVSSYAQTSSPILNDVAHSNTNAGVLNFNSELLDYGTINQNTDGTRVFKFTNTGQEPIIITNVKTSCGCTVPSFSKEPILPNESSEIKVKYDTKRVGLFSKTITVYSNASEQTKTLKIKGKILASK